MLESHLAALHGRLPANPQDARGHPEGGRLGSRRIGPRAGAGESASTGVGTLEEEAELMGNRIDRA